MFSQAKYKIKLGPYLTPVTKINFSFIQGRYVRSKSLKTLEENYRRISL